jgi:hypothetical protein
MSVFLRWGIFGILGVAALMYAYNASKRMAEKHSREPPAVAVTDQRETGVTSRPEPAPEPQRAPAPLPTTAPHCQAELVVAQRALEARRQGEPIDRLLRIQEIAFQEGPRRQRLEKVATRWYQLEGDEPIPEALSIAVISDCVRFSPAP